MMLMLINAVGRAEKRAEDGDKPVHPHAIMPQLQRKELPLWSLLHEGAHGKPDAGRFGWSRHR